MMLYTATTSGMGISGVVNGIILLVRALGSRGSDSASLKVLA